MCWDFGVEVSLPRVPEWQGFGHRLEMPQRATLTLSPIGKLAVLFWGVMGAWRIRHTQTA